MAQLLELVRQDSGPALLLIADEIQDPHNLGSLLRTAESAGAHGAVLTQRRSAPLTGVVAKASAGAMFHLPLAPAPNLARTLGDIKQEGIWTVGLAETASQSLYDLDLTVPLALVVGSEGRGLRRLTADTLDIVAALPMKGRISSLNASVAGGIALYEVLRQRETVRRSG